ncbi:MAG: acetylornithine deacetylase [Planctomycetota bacterium]
MPRKPPDRLPQAAAAHARLDALRKDLLDFTARFVAIDTTNPPGRNYLACCEFLAAKLKSLGLKPQILRVPPHEQAPLAPGLDDYPRYNLIARWDVGAKRTLLFTGHYDVVPATSGWKTDPFKPYVKQEKLYGRGTSDMKGCDAAAIFAVQALQESGQTPPWNVELAFTADEETGGYAGLGWLVKSGALKADRAVLLEGGSGENLGIAHRGVLWLEVTVHGKAGHAANPKNGINALEKALPLIRRLKRLERAYASRKSAYLGAKHARRPTLMIGGVCGGGGKINTIPDAFTFSIDRRLIPEDRLSEVKRELAEAIKDAQRDDPDLKVSVKYLLYVESGHTAPDEPIVATALEAYRAVSGKRAKLRMTGGFTDMHFLTRDGKIPSVGYGAQGGGAHSDLEFLSLASQVQTAKFYAEMAVRTDGER